MRLDFLKEFDFFTGVPDSQLKALCSYLMDTCGIGKEHIIAANEGNCVALATGYYLATGRIPVVYLQNSGLGNVVNPVASLMNEEVYGIPCIFIVGWRGEPGVLDEPQHSFQGRITLRLLSDLDIAYFPLDKTTRQEEIDSKMVEFQQLLAKGKQVAFVVKEKAIEYSNEVVYKNEYVLSREEAIRHILRYSGKNTVVSTTGKASRELYEIRERNGEDHSRDFLTIGAMGHCSSIALGLALNTDERVWCLDGDGAVLMHMGAMATIGSMCPPNMVHVVLNNCAHESVGGMPTVAGQIDFLGIARGCGYTRALRAANSSELDCALQEAVREKSLCFIEIRCSITSRRDLGRPTMETVELRDQFMKTLKEKGALDG